ncbi:MAG: 2-amino-4-hydroxy-6-hydroxymethyldihydropteridine diphosphokinase [Rhizobiales bacterium]|nr:2-amino-4-hydroxy-6-hydroxymethyldihydropteridine diphosphokinase [Hyphomicrobiales bacterium]
MVILHSDNSVEAGQNAASDLKRYAGGGIYIALGANMGASPRLTLEKAIAYMPQMGMTPRAISSFYSTAAVGPTPQPDFVNTVIRVETALPVYELMEMLHRIEAVFGRVRRERWGPRVLDLDLLDYQGMVIPPVGPQGLAAGLGPIPLVLPHPGVAERGFVLLPLRDIAPGWRHPVSGAHIEVLIAHLPAAEKAGIAPIAAK